MPRLRATLPGSGVPWTKVPNALFDRLLPVLKDTELRILLALIRSTSGWNREGKPATLTYRTLERQTGRHSEAVGRAIASLREKGLIHTSGSPRRRLPARSASESGGQQTKTG